MEQGEVHRLAITKVILSTGIQRHFSIFSSEMTEVIQNYLKELE